MIVRTPPPKKQRSDVTSLPDSSPAAASDLPLVIYEDPLPLVPATTDPASSHEPSDHMLCTYQCRQMVKSDFLDALSNAEKQVHDYELKLGVLNENLSKVGAAQPNCIKEGLRRVGQKVLVTVKSLTNHLSPFSPLNKELYMAVWKTKSL